MKDKRDKKIGRKQEKYQNKVLNYTLAFTGVIILCVAVFFIVKNTALLSWISYQSKPFDFLGFTFQKAKFGQLDVYNTTITVLQKPSNTRLSYDLYLRNDPRELALPDFTILFQRESDVYVSVDEAVGSCKEANSYLFNFAQYLTALGLDVKAASPNKTVAFEKQIPYASCNDSIYSTVILFEMGNESILKKQGGCYIIEVARCSDLLTKLEEFTVGTLASFKPS